MAKNEIMMTPELEAALLKSSELEKQIADLTAALAAKSNRTVEVTMSEYGSGTVSVRGINRFPISLHPEQWPRLFAVQGQVEAYISAHSDDLRVARFAAAWATKRGKKWISGKSKEDPSAIEYMAAYDEGKKLAVSDKSLDAAPKGK